MAKYRERLPQLEPGDALFLTDGGLETTLVFHHGMELPHFASFPLLTTEAGRRQLDDYFARYAELARKHGAGLVVETPTWRASREWGEALGHDAAALAELNAEAVRQLEGVRERFETAETPIVISGNLGPRGDGYDPATLQSADAAQEYHSAQIETFAASQADLVSALTITHVEEAIGIARAARAAEMPVVICFTLETVGRLPTGQTLGEAIEVCDRETGGYVAYYGINCAHPSHFEAVLREAGTAGWLERLRMVRANASRKSHAELDEATELDEGNPPEFGEECSALRRWAHKLNVLGGCCGTDPRHVEAIAEAIGR